MTKKRNMLKIPKILVVDDSSIMRLIIRKQLELDGYMVLEATNGREAVISFQKYRPEMVLMDISMPEMDGILATKKIIAYDQEAIIIMVSAMRQRDHVLEAMANGASDYVIKPIDIDRLITSIHRRVPPPKHFRQPKRDSRVRILVAEDQPVTQRMIQSILEKKGWEITTVSNGQEVLEVLEKIDFHLIIMDLEMPEMDGYETTTSIRQGEKFALRHLPIIGMTAHEKKEYRQKALLAGMDDLIFKPFETEKLYRTIEEILKELEIEEKKRKEGIKEKDPPLDVKQIIEDLGGDKLVLQEMVEVFFQEYPQVLENLKEAMKKRDAPTISKLAHGLKGELGNLRAKEAFTAVSRLKEMADNEDLDRVLEVMLELEKRIHDIDTFTSIEGWENK